MNLLKKLKLAASYLFKDKPFNGPELESNFKIEKLDFDLEKYYAFLKSIGNGFEQKAIETIHYKNKSYPIFCLDFNAKHENAKKLFILSGTHGNEQASMLATELIIKELTQNSSKYEHVAIRIITPHNPVACQYFSHYNQDGYDVNRDFKKQKTAETRAIVKVFEQFDPDFCLSLHEGPQKAGMFVYTNQLVPKDLVSSVLSNLKKENIMLAEKSYYGNKLKTPGHFPIRGMYLLLIKFWSILFGYQSFNQFCTAKRTPAIITEASYLTGDSSQRTKAQFHVFKSLTNNILK